VARGCHFSDPKNDQKKGLVGGGQGWARCGGVRRHSLGTQLRKQYETGGEGSGFPFKATKEKKKKKAKTFIKRIAGKKTETHEKEKKKTATKAHQIVANNS